MPPTSTFLVVLVGLSFLPVAAADEGQADCEDGQPYVGYARTEALRVIVQEALDGQAGLAVCEGEQWDGQDAVAPDAPGDCTPSLVADPSALHAQACMPADPNAPPSADPLAPAAFRLSSANGQEAYASANLALVGRVAVYAGACEGDGPGLEGDEQCGGTSELRTGVYIRDNTPGNVLATAVQCSLSITGCYPTENDCSYDDYLWMAMQGQSYACSRDNTAFGFGVILP